MIVIHNLSKEHLPLALEVRLGIRASRSETSSLLVSPVAGLPAQVSMCPIRVGACATGGQGPAFTGTLFLWGGCDKEDDILAASQGLSDMKVGATQSPGGGSLRQGVLRKELTWQVGGTAGRPECLRSDQGNGRELVSEQWAMGVCGMEAIRWSRAEEGCHLMWELRDFSDGHWRGDRRSS